MDPKASLRPKVPQSPNGRYRGVLRKNAITVNQRACTRFGRRLAGRRICATGCCTNALGRSYPGRTDIDAALTRFNQKLSTRDSFAFSEALLAAKDEWLDTVDGIHDLLNFYKTQITAWRKQATVAAVNEELTQARREKALLSNDGKLAVVQAKLDASSETHLETEADVEAFVAKLNAELMATLRAGQIAQVQ